MRKINEKKPLAFLPMLVIWIGLSVGLPATMIGNHASSLHEYLFSFQTLIGGALAAAAAYFTIRKMTEIEERQANRHNELVALQLRPDSLLLRRTMYPIMMSVWDGQRLMAEMLWIRHGAEQLVSSPDPLESSEDKYKIETLRLRCQAASRLAFSIGQRIETIEQERVESLLGPVMLLRFDEMRELAGYLRDIPAGSGAGGGWRHFGSEEFWSTGDKSSIIGTIRNYAEYAEDFYRVAQDVDRMFRILVENYPEPLGIEAEHDEFKRSPDR